MDTETTVGIVGVVATAGFSIYAINDARTQVRQLISVARGLAWEKVVTDLAWLFVEPTEKVYTREITKGLEEFSVLSRALDPQKKAEVLKDAAEHQALALADELVRGGGATWKSNLDVEKAKRVIEDWKAAKNVAHAPRDPV
jgi:tryptophan synthase beta subunit